MSSSRIERKLAAIMFTDIAEYTALSAKDSTKASELLKTQRDTLKPIVEKHGGSWMKEMGDGLLLTFDSATSAVECSIAIQEATKDIEDLNLRIGIHEGEVIKQDGDVIGDDVNVASRIEPFSAVGGVAISDKIYRAISSNTEFETKYIGKPKLKGVAQEVKVYCITSHGLPETDVSKVSAKLEEESKFNIFALTGGILTAIGVAFWIAVGVFDVSFGGKAEVPSVGILMMENLGKEDEEFWSSGMTADLITRVAGAGLIRVAPLKDIRSIDSNLSIEEIAKKLRVKYILTHSFLIKDDGFDLWCKLENTENGVALFSNKISEPMSMTTQMVGKLANDIITSLKVKTKQDVMKAPTNNAKAYEYYLKGKYIFKTRHNKEDIKLAIGFIKEAISLDNKLLKAKNYMAWIYLEKDDIDKAINILKASLNQAEKNDDQYMIAHTLIMIGKANINYDINKSIKYFERALQISEENNIKGNIGDALASIGSIFAFSKGDYKKGLDYIRRALKIAEELDDQQYKGFCLMLIGDILQKSGESEESLDYFNRSLKIFKEVEGDRNISLTLKSIGVNYFNKGNYSMAEKYFKETFDTQKKIEFRPSYLYTLTYLLLSNKNLSKEYDGKEIYTLIKETGNRTFEINLRLYELLEDNSYLETAYKQVQEKADNLEPDVAAKFLSYPVPKAIVEEWEKVK